MSAVFTGGAKASPVIAYKLRDGRDLLTLAANPQRYPARIGLSLAG